MSLPDAARLMRVVEATWPAAATRACGPFTLRDGQGGGSRVSAATLSGTATRDQIAEAAAAMRAMGQPALFQVRAGQEGFDAELATLGYAEKDASVLYAAPVEAIATQRPPPITSFEVWPLLEVQREIWADGGIGPARLAVMARAAGPKTTLLGRIDECPAGTAYVAIAEGCAMIHALEIAADARRRGLARHLTRGAAFWARDNGADFLTLVTTRANKAANALYASLGMTLVGGYHYRILNEAPT